MNKTSFAAIFGMVCGGVLSGCVQPAPAPYVEHPPVVVKAAPEVIVTQPPPPPRQEVLVTAPSPTYVWVPGYWTWQGNWIWVRGHYMVAPHPHAVWIAGRWAPRAHGWVWIPGYWR